MASKVEVQGAEDPVLAALARAPIGEPLSAEEEAMVREALEDPRPALSSAEVSAMIEKMRREQEGP